MNKKIVSLKYMILSEIEIGIIPSWSTIGYFRELDIHHVNDGNVCQ